MKFGTFGFGAPLSQLLISDFFCVQQPVLECYVALPGAPAPSCGHFNCNCHMFSWQNKPWPVVIIILFLKTSHGYRDSFSNFIRASFNHLCRHICPVAHWLNCGCNLSQSSLLTLPNIHVTRGKVSCQRTKIRIWTANSDWDLNSHPCQITATSFFWGEYHSNYTPATSNSSRPSPANLFHHVPSLPCCELSFEAFFEKQLNQRSVQNERSWNQLRIVIKVLWVWLGLCYKKK